MLTAQEVLYTCLKEVHSYFLFFLLTDLNNFWQCCSRENCRINWLWRSQPVLWDSRASECGRDKTCATNCKSA